MPCGDMKGMGYDGMYFRVVRPGPTGGESIGPTVLPAKTPFSKT